MKGHNLRPLWALGIASLFISYVQSENALIDTNKVLVSKKESLITKDATKDVIAQDDKSAKEKEQAEKIKKEEQSKKEEEKLKKEQEEKERKEKEEKEKADKEKIKKQPFTMIAGDSEWRLLAKFRPEGFFGKNLRFLNHKNHSDGLAYFRHTADFVGEYHFGLASKKYDVFMLRAGIRNRGIWGDPESIASTTESELKRLDVAGLGHRHGIPRHILWIRELWMQMSLNDVLGIPFKNPHTLTVGAFPFELGRGIALGSAYAVGLELLGYFSETAIDQYAFGAKFSGVVVKDNLIYDLYAAILDNKSSTFAHTNARIRHHEFGHKFNTARGFGIINYLVAGRLKWTPFAGPQCTSLIEPYIVFNDQREQKIEFLGDASSKLVTPGFSGEFSVGCLEFGFDTAFNFGSQCVKGIDRNTIIEQNRNGFAAIVNSKVKQIDPVTGKSDLALVVDANQKIINNSPECETENGQVIGSNSLGTLINDNHRFRNPYKVFYKGSMFVCDVGWHIKRPELKINAAMGFASGDDNPHKDLIHLPNGATGDVVYNGFIGLQEAYTGTRVKSAFMLSGSGKIPRVLSFPTEEVIDPYPTLINQFTNLVYTGASAQLKLEKTRNKWYINPNVLAYWQEFPTLIPRKERKISDSPIKMRQANQFLGTEVNTFIEGDLLPDLKFFFIGAVFIPGKHYHDIHHLPLNKDQLKYIEFLEAEESEAARMRADKVPLLGTDPSWFINFGLEYKF